jgi:hypothetical protein
MLLLYKARENLLKGIKLLPMDLEDIAGLTG